MSRSPRLGAALYETESSWGENTSTFGTRLRTIGVLDCSKLEQQKLNPDRTVQFRNEITPGVNGIMGGEFTVRMTLTGHGATTAGAISLSALETLLGLVVGNVAAAGTNTTGAGTGTASAPGVAAASGGTAGALARFGALGDGRANGQFAALSSHATSVMTLLTELPANMNNGDVVYNPAIVYPTELPTSNDITSTRWLLQGANQEHEAHGCYPKRAVWSGFGPGEEPMVDITFGTSWWKPVATSFPTATSVQTYAHAPVAAGSFFMADQGTATRSGATYNIRSFSLTIDLGIVELRGPGGVNASQVVTGCKRVPDRISGEFVVDAEDAATAPALGAKWLANTPQHILYSWSVADTTAGAVYLPYVVPDGPRPTQFDLDGLNRTRFRFRAGTDASKSTALERAAYRFASG